MTERKLLFRRGGRGHIVRWQVQAIDGRISSAIEYISSLANLSELRVCRLLPNHRKISISGFFVGQIGHVVIAKRVVRSASNCLNLCRSWCKAKIALADIHDIGLGEQATSVVIEVNIGAVSGLEVHDLLGDASSVREHLNAVLHELALSGQCHAVGKLPVAVSVFAGHADCTSIQSVNRCVACSHLSQSLGVVLSRSVSSFFGLCPSVVFCLVGVSSSFQSSSGGPCNSGVFKVFSDDCKISNLFVNRRLSSFQRVQHCFVVVVQRFCFGGRRLSFFCRSICCLSSRVCVVSKCLAAWRSFSPPCWVAFIVFDRTVRNISPILATLAVISHFVTATNALVVRNISAIVGR